jgi:hypothetical protein
MALAPPIWLHNHYWLWPPSAHPWYAANDVPPINGAHGMQPMAYTYPSTYYTICHYWLWALSAHPSYAANGMPPSHRAHGVPPIHIHGSRPTRQSYAAQPLCPWYAANIGYGHCRPTHGMPPIVCRPAIAAHPYSWLSAHPSTSSISYTTYPSTYYTIYTTIGYGHCRPTRMHWHHNIVYPIGSPLVLVPTTAKGPRPIRL